MGAPESSATIARMALYGLDFLTRDKEREKKELDDRHSTGEVIRLREELCDQTLSPPRKYSRLRRTAATTFPGPAPITNL
jgi:formate C-acetyltransferase